MLAIMKMTEISSKMTEKFAFNFVHLTEISDRKSKPILEGLWS